MPGEEDVGVGVGVVAGVERLVGGVEVGEVVARCHGPGGGAYAYYCEENGEEAEDGFPEEGGVVGVHGGAGWTRHCGNWECVKDDYVDGMKGSVDVFVKMDCKK